jgi:type I restriction enzyme S subunit
MKQKHKQEKYKETKLGMLPPDWEVVKVTDVFGFTKKPRDLKLKKDQKIPFISMDLISETKILAGWQMRRPSEIKSGNYVSKNDLIVGKITPCFENGKQAILSNLPNDFGFATTEVWTLHPINEKVISEHLYAYLKFPKIRNELAVKMEGTTGRQRLPKHVLANFTFPLPPLQEQKKIAHVLSKIQISKEKTENTISAFQELKKSLMKHLFNYGPVSPGQIENVKLKEIEIGKIPKKWEVTELKEIVDITYGVQAAVANLTDKNIGIPILTNINISLNGILNLSTLRYYGLPTDKRKKLLLKKGDILFNWRSGSQNHIGKTAIFNLEGDYTFSSFILRFRVKNDVDNLYLFYYLYYLKNIGYFMSQRDQSSVNSVFNASRSAKLITLVPDKDTQLKIASILSAVDEKIEKLENKRKALNELFNSMLHDLMTAKIRVNDLEVENG